MKQKKITWNKSGRERVRRENLTCAQFSKARPQAKKHEERDGDRLSDRLEEFPKKKEEEDEEMCLIEKIRQNLEAAQRGHLVQHEANGRK